MLYFSASPDSPLLATLCGNLYAGQHLFSSGPDMYITFMSDSSITRNGFVLQYTAIDPSAERELGMVAQFLFISVFCYKKNFVLSSFLNTKVLKHVHTAKRKRSTCRKQYLWVDFTANMSTEQLTNMSERLRPKALVFLKITVWFIILLASVIQRLQFPQIQTS